MRAWHFFKAPIIGASAFFDLKTYLMRKTSHYYIFIKKQEKVLLDINKLVIMVIIMIHMVQLNIIAKINNDDSTLRK